MLHSSRVYDKRALSRAHSTRNAPGEADKTVQSDAKGADINTIVKRFGVSGQLPPPGKVVPRFADFKDAPDFRGAMQVIVQAREAFLELPSRIRERFVTAEAYVDFCDNPDNKDELIRLGIAKPDPLPPKEIISKVEIVSDKSTKRKRSFKGDDLGESED